MKCRMKIEKGTLYYPQYKFKFWPFWFHFKKENHFGDDIDVRFSNEKDCLKFTQKNKKLMVKTRYTNL